MEKLGFKAIHFHISRNEFSDYSFGLRDEQRSYPEKFTVGAPFRDALTFLQPGQHAVSHLPPDYDVEDACRDFNIKVLFLFRDLRDCAISYMRFLADTGRDKSRHSDWMKAEDGPERFRKYLEVYNWFFRAAEPLLSWRNNDRAYSVQYEALVGDFGEEVQHGVLDMICRHLSIDADSIDFPQILRASLNVSTLTWSGNRTERSDYWSEACERAFVELGGADVNRQLGYG